MRLVARVARLGDRLFDALRDERAFSVTPDGAVVGDFAPLRDAKYAVLTTFRRDGTPVPSPVWFALDQGGRVVLKTVASAGKVKRLRRDERAVVAPSSLRGTPLGRSILATGRELPASEWDMAEVLLARRYGAGRRIAERVLGIATDDPTYIELVPRTGRE